MRHMNLFVATWTLLSLAAVQVYGQAAPAAAGNAAARVNNPAAGAANAVQPAAAAAANAANTTTPGNTVPEAANAVNNSSAVGNAANGAQFGNTQGVIGNPPVFPKAQQNGNSQAGVAPGAYAGTPRSGNSQGAPRCKGPPRSTVGWWPAAQA